MVVWIALLYNYTLFASTSVALLSDKKIGLLHNRSQFQMFVRHCRHKHAMF